MSRDVVVLDMGNYAEYFCLREAYMHSQNQHPATKVDLKELELRLLKWQLAIGLALATIMAKGFGWLGF